MFGNCRPKAVTDCLICYDSSDSRALPQPPLPFYPSISMPIIVISIVIHSSPEPDLEMDVFTSLKSDPSSFLGRLDIPKPSDYQSKQLALAVAIDADQGLPLGTSAPSHSWVLEVHLSPFSRPPLTPGARIPASRLASAISISGL